MANGYVGKVLQVDLSTGVIWPEELDWDLAADYVGGRGLADKIIFDTVKPGTDPLGPDNVLVFATGPLTGTPAPACGRSVLASKSPLTGTIFDSNSGGLIGPELKKAGFDAVVIRGRSERPVYLAILNGRAELRPADHLWGRTTSETVRALKREVGDDRARVACIGPAGEKGVLLANVICEPHRAFGRGGLGAVMGSKGLKAMVVRGRGRVEVANPHAFKRVCREIKDILARNPITGDLLGRYGTGCLTTPVNKAGILPTKNFRTGFFEEAEEITGEKLVKVLGARRRACFGCPIGCGRVVEVKEGPYATPRTDGPGYEAVAAFGSNLLVDDLKAIAHINYLCNALGLDVISTGVVIGFAYRLFEEGVIGPADTGDLELKWGDPEPAVELVKAIASREGLGTVMAEGVRHMGRVFGREEEAAHVKGLEVPFHDPRAFFGMAVCYATSPRGACHLQGDMYMIDMGVEFPEFGITSGDRFDLAGRIEVVARIQDLRAIYNALVMCQFANLDGPILRDLLASVTGWDIRPGELALTGERIFNLKRIFNLRMGVGPAEDRLPELLLRPLPDGGAAGKAPDLKALLAEYYRVRSWDPETGWPKPEKLAELGLEQFARG